MNRLVPALTGALLLVLAGGSMAQGRTMEAAEKLEQDALKRARVLRIVGIPGVQPSVEAALKALGGQVAGQEAKMELPSAALFTAGQAELKPEAAATLEKVAMVLREFPAAPLQKSYAAIPALIECHADDAAAEADNKALAEKRAAAVRDWLIENAAIDPVRLPVRAEGPSKPGRVAITVRKAP